MLEFQKCYTPHSNGKKSLLFITNKSIPLKCQTVKNNNNEKLLSLCFRYIQPLCVPPGFFAIVVSAVAVAVAVHQGVDLTYIHSHFLQLSTATFIISVLLSFYLYVRSRYASPAELALGGNSGKELADHIHSAEPLHYFNVPVVINLPFLCSLLSFSRQCGL